MIVHLVILLVSLVFLFQTRQYIIDNNIFVSDGQGFKVHTYRSSMISYDQYMIIKLIVFIFFAFLSFNLFFYNLFSVSSRKQGELDKRVMRRTDKEIKEILEKEKEKNKK
jgi:hypothetical protein